ncbi:serine hydrolase domain-containing protein [Collimonas sp. NPDC087041]|uniref:serine hydrolase domain-containing protein n=1 Tax=Collimonas sp. NPDC087041 TaxID=3363960 RepID=UPI003822968F
MSLRLVLCVMMIGVPALLSVAFSAEPGAGQSIPASSALDIEVPKEMAAVGANGLAIAVIDGGKVVYVRAFGRRNEEGQALREDTVMSAASLTKPVFAYAVMQLVGEGRISLDASIADYLEKPLPAYSTQRPYATWKDLDGDERWRQITPRILLSHRSGLANFQSLEADGRLHIHFDPGSRFAYSGDGINLLQFVLERGLGLNTNTELQQRVFERFGMSHTSMMWQESGAINQADGYADSSWGSKRARPHIRRSHVAAASSMDTTIEDYARFAAGFVRGEGLSPSNHQEMISPQWPITTKTQFPTLQSELPTPQRIANLAAGLGVVVFEGPQGPGFYKGGHEDTVGNVWVCVTRQQRCVVLLSNDVRAEKAFPKLVGFVLGDAGVPWQWEYGK